MMEATITTQNGLIRARVVRTGRPAGSWQWQRPYGYGVRVDGMRRCLSGSVVGKIPETQARKGQTTGPARGWEAVDRVARQIAERNLRILVEGGAEHPRQRVEVENAARRANKE